MVKSVKKEDEKNEGSRCYPLFLSDCFIYFRFPSRMIKSPCLFSGRNKSNFIGFADG
nr:MAG TPA: hypothetical protein [Caudoviricetes sp.]